MTSQEALKRSEKSQNLKAFHLQDTPWYYVESEEGKICYKVCFTSTTDYFCNCGDFSRGFKNDSTFKCKHIMAVMNSITEGDAENIHYLERWRPKLDESFIKQIDDKDFVLYAGLLDCAHQKNLISVNVELIQFPNDENKQTAICKATVETADGRKFSDLGDANPQNCNSKVAKHLIRLSSTRAKARAFRDMDNIGMTALEELGDLSEVIGNKPTAQQRNDNVKAFVKPAANKALALVKKTEDQLPAVNTKEPVTEKQSAPVDTPADSSNAVDAVAPVNSINTINAASAEIVSAKEKKTKAAKPGNGNGAAKTEKIPLMSEAQKSALFNLSRRRGISLEDIATRAMDKYGVPVEQLTSNNAGEFIRYLQAAS